VPVFHPKPLNAGCEICPQETSKNPSIVWCEVYLDILNCLGVNHGCDRQTDRRRDGQTRDILITDAALRYVARAMIWISSVERKAIELSTPIEKQSEIGYFRSL